MCSAFQWHLVLKFTESTGLLCNHSSDDCEIARFDITQRGVFKENFAKSPTLKGQIISVQQPVKKSAGSKS